MTAEPAPSPFDSWDAAEAHFGKELNRRVTRANITAAAAAVSVASECLVVVATSERSMSKRLAAISERVTTLEEAGDVTDSTLAEGLDLLTGRIGAIDEVLAREAARLDTAESNREAVQTELGHLSDQIKQVTGEVRILKHFMNQILAPETSVEAV